MTVGSAPPLQAVDDAAFIERLRGALAHVEMRAGGYYALTADDLRRIARLIDAAPVFKPEGPSYGKSPAKAFVDARAELDRVIAAEERNRAARTPEQNRCRDAVKAVAEGRVAELEAQTKALLGQPLDDQREILRASNWTEDHHGC